MLIHSIVPTETIFNSDKQYDKVSYARYNGILVEVIKGDTASRIVRIISSDPRHYLNSSIQPSLDVNNRELFFTN